MAVNYGQVAIVPKGVWNAETQYKVNNLVEYDGSSYVAKVQPPVGTLPTDTSYWQVSAAGTKKATPDSLGTVMPDGTTTEIKEDGKLSAKTAQQNALGVVKGSDDITVGEDGNLSVNTTFEQATEIANIIAGEAIKSVLGKVSKAIATTMSLDENALLKNMISGIDVNDGNKVPSSAYIHTLVERIGMGTELSGFDNLTAGLNSVNNNLSNAMKIGESIYSGASIINGNINNRYGCFQFNVSNGTGILEGVSVFQMILESSGISLLAFKNGYWKTIWSTALKSDLVDAVTYNPMLMYDGSKTVAAFCQSVKSGTTAVVYVPSNYDTKTTGIPEKGACFITVYKSTTSGYGFFDALMSGGKHYYCTEDNGKTSGWA